MLNCYQAARIGRSITDSPIYAAAREHAETDQAFGSSLENFTKAMISVHGADIDQMEIVSAYVYAWGMFRRSIPDPVRSDFRIIAPEVCREVRAAGYDWETVLEGLGKPTPGIAYDYRNNLLPEPPANIPGNWWFWALRRWGFKLGGFGAVSSRK